MFKFIVMFIICLSKLAIANDEYHEQTCNTISDQSLHYQLKNHLFCDYDPTVRPGLKNLGTNVTIAMIISLLRFDESRGTLELNGWDNCVWKDVHLNWTPSDFGDIDRIIVKSTQIWIPQLFSLTPSKDASPRIPIKMCRLHHSGKVACRTLFQFTTNCRSDYTYWPYDVHDCTFEVGFFNTPNDQIAWNRSPLLFTIDSGTSNWNYIQKITGQHAAESRIFNNQTFATLSASYTVMRAYSATHLIIISFVIVLTIMTLNILWLRAGSAERLTLACVNVLSHLLAIEYLHWQLPSTGSTIPNILTCYIICLILSAIALILTCCLQNLTQCKKEVPMWLATQVSIIRSSKVGHVLSISITDAKAKLLDDDDNNGSIEPETKEVKWESVVTVIGWISFFSFGFIYVVIFVVLLR